jgi:hypothetical protein
MLLLAIYLLYAVALGRAVEQGRQHPLVGNSSGLRDVPGSSLVRLCPESRDDDVLAIERIVNIPQLPVLYVLCFSLVSGLIGVFRNGEVDVFIWGNITLTSVSLKNLV